MLYVRVRLCAYRPECDFRHMRACVCAPVHTHHHICLCGMGNMCGGGGGWIAKDGGRGANTRPSSQCCGRSDRVAAVAGAQSARARRAQSHTHARRSTHARTQEVVLIFRMCPSRMFACAITCESDVRALALSVRAALRVHGGRSSHTHAKRFWGHHTTRRRRRVRHGLWCGVWWLGVCVCGIWLDVC